MLSATFTARFSRDVKRCQKRHWDMAPFKQAIVALLHSDETALASTYRDHALQGNLSGYRSLHVPTRGNPPKNSWVLMYRVDGREVTFVRTGSHDEVYGRQEA